MNVRSAQFTCVRFLFRMAPAVFAFAFLFALVAPVHAQYTVTNLVSNQNAIGSNPADPDLVNAWGITSLATSPFWASDNLTGKSTLYNSLGQKQGLVVTVPTASGTGQGLPTVLSVTPRLTALSFRSPPKEA